MTLRLAAALALSLAAAASPALAQTTPSFTAWGHEFSVPGATAAAGAITATGTYTMMSTGSLRGGKDAMARPAPGRAAQR